MYDGDIMLIKAPLNKRFHDKMCSCCKVLLLKGGEVIYEAISDISVSSADLGMGTRKFIEFCRKIVVENGRKVRKGSMLLFKPNREKVFFIRLSDWEFQLLAEYAKEQKTSVSLVIREVVDSVVLKAWLNDI